MKTGKTEAQIQEEEDLSNFILQKESKGIKREAFDLKAQEIDNSDPIE